MPSRHNIANHVFPNVNTDKSSSPRSSVARGSSFPARVRNFSLSFVTSPSKAQDKVERNLRKSHDVFNSRRQTPSVQKPKPRGLSLASICRPSLALSPTYKTLNQPSSVQTITPRRSCRPSYPTITSPKLYPESSSTARQRGQHERKTSDERGSDIKTPRSSQSSTLSSQPQFLGKGLFENIPNTNKGDSRDTRNFKSHKVMTKPSSQFNYPVPCSTIPTRIPRDNFSNPPLQEVRQNLKHFDPCQATPLQVGPLSPPFNRYRSQKKDYQTLQVVPFNYTVGAGRPKLIMGSEGPRPRTDYLALASYHFDKTTIEERFCERNSMASMHPRPHQTKALDSLDFDKTILEKPRYKRYSMASSNYSSESWKEEEEEEVVSDHESLRRRSDSDSNCTASGSGVGDSGTTLYMFDSPDTVQECWKFLGDEKRERKGIGMLSSDELQDFGDNSHHHLYALSR